MKNRGFTLIELMVVIVVAGILMGMGVVSFYSMIIKARVRGSADKIVQELQGARERALARGHTITITFSVSAAGGCTISEVYNTATPINLNIPPFNDCRLGFISTRPNVIPPGAVNAVVGVASTGIDFPSNNLIFQPQGVGTVGAVYIKSMDDKTQYVITVNANGRVDKYVWGGSGWN